MPRDQLADGIFRHFSFANDARDLKVCAGERIIGYLYNFRLDNRVYAYQSGLADTDLHERPGYVAHALAIRHVFSKRPDAGSTLARALFCLMSASCRSISTWAKKRMRWPGSWIHSSRRI